jgi:putative transposase
MARIARVVLPGIPHHVTQRGNRRQQTFFNDEDYQVYLSLLTQSCGKYDTEVWAWCLMPNHVHLVLVPSSVDGLRASLAEAHRRYTRRINFREGWRGHLWQERFHSFPMDESYLLATVRYVELNPVKARLVERPQDWRWSSASARLGQVADGLTKLEPLQNLIHDWPAFWASGTDDQLVPIRLHTRTGRPLGSDTFVEKVERTVGRILRREKPGPKSIRGRDDEQAIGCIER